MAFSVQTASKADIHELIKIHMAAFANDNAVRLMFKSEDEYEAKLQGILSSGSSDPRAFTLKAVSDDSNEILAWLGYVCIEYSELGAPPSPSELTAETLLNPTLRSILIADFERVQNEWMADKKYIHIGTAVTHPSHQGKGIGSALIRSMTSRADEDDVPCWIQSSPVAHSVYYHAGFRDVGSFEVDLREWAPGGKEGKTGWGVFEISDEEDDEQGTYNFTGAGTPEGEQDSDKEDEATPVYLEHHMLKGELDSDEEHQVDVGDSTKHH